MPKNKRGRRASTKYHPQLFQYQRTGWDCAPTTFLNALSYLRRNGRTGNRLLPLHVVQRIWAVRNNNEMEIEGKSQPCGTGWSAPRYLAMWLPDVSDLNVAVAHYYGDKVLAYRGEDEKGSLHALDSTKVEYDGETHCVGEKDHCIAIEDCLRHGGVVACHVWFFRDADIPDNSHWILAIADDEEWFHFFDPLKSDRGLRGGMKGKVKRDILVPSSEWSANLRILKTWLNGESKKPYMLGEASQRELLVFRPR